MGGCGKRHAPVDFSFQTSTVREAVWDSGSIWNGAEDFSPTEFDLWTVQAIGIRVLVVVKFISKNT